jgi:Methyltransferase domain
MPVFVEPIDLGPLLGRDDHATLRHVLTLKPQGHAAEFGVWRGITLAAIAAVMPVTGFDSFHGLPEDWRPGFPKGMFAGNIPILPPNAELVVGMFEDTVPGWEPPAPLGLCHVDCDLYSSTVTVLAGIERHLHPGTYIVMDEFHGYPGAEHHEQRAWREFVARTGITYRVIGHGREQWACQLT